MGLGNRPGTGPGLPAILADAHDNIVLPLVGIFIPPFGECQELALADTEQGGNADGRIGITLPGAEYGHSPVRRETGFLFLPERRQCHGAYGTHQTLEYGIHHPLHLIPFSPSVQQPCHACAPRPEKKGHKEKHAAETRYRRRETPEGFGPKLKHGSRASGYGNPEKRPPEPGNIRKRESAEKNPCLNANAIPHINRPSFFRTNCLPIYSSKEKW